MKSCLQSCRAVFVVFKNLKIKIDRDFPIDLYPFSVNVIWLTAVYINNAKTDTLSDVLFVYVRRINPQGQDIFQSISIIS